MVVRVVVMGYVPEIAVALVPWRSGATLGALHEALEPRFGPVALNAPQPELAALVKPRRKGFEGGVMLDRLSPNGLIAAIDIGARGNHWAIAICARPTTSVVPLMRRTAIEAKRRPWGAAVRRDHLHPIVPTLDTVINLHVAVLRSRRPTAWRAIDAVRQHGTATLAAKALGCSTQAITRQLRESNAKATGETARLIAHLFEYTPPPSPSAGLG